MPKPTLDELDATIQVAILGAYADDTLAEEERDVLRRCIAMRSEDEAQAKVLMQFASRLPHRMKSLTAEARKVRMEELRLALSAPGSRERAFALAVEVAGAHQGIGLREMRYLMSLVTELRIDPAYARALVDEALRSHPSSSDDPAAVEKTLRSTFERFDDHSVGPETEKDDTITEGSDEPLSFSDTLVAGTSLPPDAPTRTGLPSDTLPDDPPTERDFPPDSHH